MNWNNLCGINAITGKTVDIPTLVGPGVDHDRHGRTGVPNDATLTTMMNAAGALRLTEAPRTRRGSMSDGISFHIVQYVPGGASLATTSQFVDQKTGSAVCYEDILFNDTLADRINAVVGNIVVHQSVTPYTRCRAGYHQLAQNGPHTIVISSDDGYDNAPDNIIFFFAPTGLVFYRH